MVKEAAMDTHNIRLYYRPARTGPPHYMYVPFRGGLPGKETVLPIDHEFNHMHVLSLNNSRAHLIIPLSCFLNAGSKVFVLC